MFFSISKFMFGMGLGTTRNYELLFGNSEPDLELVGLLRLTGWVGFGMGLVRISLSAS